MTTRKIALTIPIKLQNRQEIAAALKSRYGGDYLLMGRIFQSTITTRSCEIDIYNAANNFVSAWKIAGQNNISLTLDQLNFEQQLILLTSIDTGYEACRQIAQLAQVFLQIGGIAIKVESTGIVHEPQKWLDNYNSSDVFDIYTLFVTLIEGDCFYYSCGMFNFGKADVKVEISEDLSLAVYVMNVFNYYRLTESPILQDGHTFQPDIECPAYTMRWIEDQESELDSPLHNPYGRWLLSRSVESSDKTSHI
ncbi:MAG: hypothetical protein AAGE84_24675 [Cyanobacteria bacterium P01_G01_bin.39]